VGSKKQTELNKKITIFDTTLRDGSQGENISFSLDDKFDIAKKLDDFGVDYIEGGWPGANPKDAMFFEKASLYNWKNSRLVAFGSTRRKENRPQEDKNLDYLLRAETPGVSIFGKTWLLHTEKALGISPEENLKMIFDSVDFIRRHGREVIFDAEHFFDGYKDDPEFAFNMLQAAIDGGASVIVLCDTNGGSMPHEVYNITKEVIAKFGVDTGIHAHNDSDLAVANTLEAVRAGAGHVQGTINGYGERCGNANLVSVIPNLQLKMKLKCIGNEKMKKLTDLSAYVNEVANLVPRNESPFAGASAFAHKGGIHVSAVMKDHRTYEHIDPSLVGNKRRVLVSDLSGKSNVAYKVSELGLENLSLSQSKNIVNKIKDLENRGYSFESADASFELLVKNLLNESRVFFSLSGFRQFTEKDSSGKLWSEASIRVSVNGVVEHTAAEGNGPVNALDNALRKALGRFYPEVNRVRLTDYKVRVLNEAGKSGTGSGVRVLIETRYNNERWSTVGVSENIIEASWQALVDAYNYFLHKTEEKSNVEERKNETQSIDI